MGRARQIILTTIVLLACHRGLWAQSRIEWVGSWAEAQALATRHQRLMLIHFWSADCPPCLKLERAVFNQPEFIRAVATNYVALKVNVADDPALARHYGVEQWPTDVILAANGQELYRGISPAEMNRYISQLDQTAAYARLGMPNGGSPTTDFSAANTAASRDRASAFPNGTPAGSAYLPPAGDQASGGYQPGSYNNPSAQTAQSIYNPTMGPAQPNSPVNPVGPSSVYGPPRVNPSATAFNPNTPYGAADAPAANPGAAAAAAPAYVTNQWVRPQAGPPIAEQRASYTAPSGGEFQPPAAASSSQFPVPRASASTLGPPFTANSAVLGPPSYDVSASSAVMNGPEVGPPSMGPPPRMDGPTMGPPSSAVPPQAPPTAGMQDPPLALDGYCPVTLVEREKWVKGDPKYGAYHRGRTYLFAGPQEQARFLDPAGQDKFAPALSGYDPVKYTEQGALVDGKRVHGVFYHGQVYLFADEAALQQFWTAPERYAPTVRAEQQRSAAMRPGLQR